MDSILLDGGVIKAVGPFDDIQDEWGVEAEVTRVLDGWISPGFQDSHVHPFHAGLQHIRCELDDLDSVAGYEARIAEFAQTKGETEWIIGGGWAMGLFPGGTPPKEILDRVTDGRPAVLKSRDGHSVWVNSKALELSGLESKASDPPDGRIERMSTGELQGTLHEGAMSLVWRVVPKPTRREYEDGFSWSQSQLYSFGITAWQDAHVSDTEIGIYKSLERQGFLKSRVVGAQWWERERGLEQVEEMVDRWKSEGTDGVDLGTVKIMLDGVIENCTADCLSPYIGPSGEKTDNYGKCFVDPALLAKAVVAFDKAGMQVHFHAVGDRAVRNALNACEHAQKVNGATDNRHHIAHIEVIHPEDIPRFAQLNVTANMQPYWAAEDDEMRGLRTPFLGASRSTWQFPFGSLLRTGARLAAGSDWPVSTPDPLLGMGVAVNRFHPDEGDLLPYLPGERIGVREAHRAYTEGTAYINRLDKVAGLVAPGRRGDVVVLNRNPFKVDPQSINGVRVAMTIVGGECVYRAESGAP